MGPPVSTHQAVSWIHADSSWVLTGCSRAVPECKNGIGGQRRGSEQLRRCQWAKQRIMWRRMPRCADTSQDMAPCAPHYEWPSSADWRHELPLVPHSLELNEFEQLLAASVVNPKDIDVSVDDVSGLDGK